jgi:hypothetical protein
MLKMRSFQHWCSIAGGTLGLRLSGKYYARRSDIWDGLPVDAVQEALNYIQLQVLIEERQGRFHVKGHLRELAR